MAGYFATRIGFLLALIGSAIGLGNIWRFPYLTGQHGGGAFVVFYLFCVFLVAGPLLTSEISLGKSGRASPQFGLPLLTNQRWTSALGWLPCLTCLLVLSFYSVISGWVVCFLLQSVGTLFGKFQNLVTYFDIFLLRPWELLLYHLLFMGMNTAILWFGIQKGIERFCLWTMPILGILIVILLIYACFAGDISSGLQFMFLPRMEDLGAHAVISALGQSFFSIGIGFGIAYTYGAYLRSEFPIIRNSLWTVVFDTLASLCMGTIIFSFTQKFAIPAAAGPKLVFEVLPRIFAQMPYGNLVSCIFFVLVFIACITSSISLMEVMVFTLNGRAGETVRNRSIITSSILASVFGIFTILSFNHWKHITWWQGTFFDNIDYVTSNIFLPIFGIACAIFFVIYIKRSLIRDSFVQKERRFMPDLRNVLTYISIPIITLVAFAQAMPKIFDAVLSWILR